MQRSRAAIPPTWPAPPPTARPTADQRGWRAGFRRSCYLPRRCGYRVADVLVHSFTLGSGYMGVWEHQIVAVLQLPGRYGALERDHTPWKWISNPPSTRPGSEPTDARA